MTRVHVDESCSWPDSSFPRSMLSCDTSLKVSDVVVLCRALE